MLNYAITTKYLPATDTKGARISAAMDHYDTFGRSRIIIPYPHHVAISDTHLTAALALLRDHELSGDLIEAQIRDGFIFILTNARKNNV